MARFLTLVAIVIVFDIVATNELNSTVALNSLMDPKHRTELVDVAFLEQKDVLLEMLEAKLKEVKDSNKKKKTDLKLDSEQKLCDTLSKDKSLVMKANGISNVGIVNILMNHGTSGMGHLNLDADGISNVGRAHLELGMEGGVHLPGISNSLVASPPCFNSIFCNNKEIIEPKADLSSPDVLPKENLEDTSLRKTDINNTMVVVNSTLTGVNATGTAAIATNTVDVDTAANVTNTVDVDTSANITKTNGNATNTDVIATDTDTNAISTDVNVTNTDVIDRIAAANATNTDVDDSNDIDVSNITAHTRNIITTVTNDPGTVSASESTVTVLSNLNTVE